MENFKEIDLIGPIQRALSEENYETPTPIQAQTIPPALEDNDILGCAQTGTGKTAAFSLPILNRLGKTSRKAAPNRPLALVLAPTRELAIQIGDSIATYGRHLRLRKVLVYGGVSQHNQVRALKRGAHILIATPGRLLDLMNQGHITLDKLEVFVLDEADRMLDMGFLPDLKRIIKELPKERQSLFFSATLSPSIVDLTRQLLRNPVSVNVTPEKTSVDTIEQRIIFVDNKGKQPLLEKLLKTKEAGRVLVFTKTKRTANNLSEKLEKNGFRATAIHGNKSQSARQRALEAFRKRKVNILVATDVAARGIDIDGISHVVNYDIPMEPESYVHRIGRTGRAGAEGIALSYCSGGERQLLRSIERLIGMKIPLDADQPQQSRRQFDDGDSKPAKRNRKRPGKSSYKPKGKSSGGKTSNNGSTSPKTSAGQPSGSKPGGGKPKSGKPGGKPGGGAHGKRKKSGGKKPYAGKRVSQAK